MNIRKHTRTLAIASMLAFAVVSSVPAVHVHAKTKGPIDNGVRCSYYNNDTGEWEFYLPREYIHVKGPDGKDHFLVCGDDGYWFEGRTASPVGPRAPLPVGNAGTTLTMPAGPAPLPIAYAPGS